MLPFFKSTIQQTHPCTRGFLPALFLHPFFWHPGSLLMVEIRAACCCQPQQQALLSQWPGEGDYYYAQLLRICLGRSREGASQGRVEEEAAGSLLLLGGARASVRQHIFRRGSSSTTSCSHAAAARRRRRSIIGSGNSWSRWGRSSLPWHRSARAQKALQSRETAA